VKAAFNSIQIVETYRFWPSIIEYSIGQPLQMTITETERDTFQATVADFQPQITFHCTRA
jgi:hypothetical protein